MAVKPIIRFPMALAMAGAKYQDFIWNRFITGEPMRRVGDMIELTLDGQESVPAFSDLAELVTADGGSFENIRMALTFTALAAGRDVPAGVPGATGIDEEGNTVQRTWADWARANPQQIIRRVAGTGPEYVMKAAMGSKLLSSEQLKAANTTSGVNVVDWSVAKDYYSNGNYEEFEI